MRQSLLLLLVLPWLGCAAGSSSQPADGASDAPVPLTDQAQDTQSGEPYLWPDSAPPDGPVVADGPMVDSAPKPDSAPNPDAPNPDTAPKPDTTSKPDTAPKPDVGADSTPAPDLCGPCGPGMKCGSAGCVCDPATCTGCCDHQGNCQPGTAIGLCGSGGATCTTCSTSDPCLTASCSTGSCVAQKNPNASYPCPGAYGTVCGGSTGVGCLTGLVCVTFVSGQRGFCSHTCNSDGNCSAGAPPNVDEGCNLLAGSTKYCGFYCAPGSCPSGLSCDFSEGLCK